MQKNKDQLFKALYEKYYAPFCLYAKRYLQDKDTREDIVSDVFAKLWFAEDFILEEATAVSFLKNCIKNSCLNYLHHQTYEENYLQHLNIQPPVYSDSPESIYTLDEMYKHLYDAINKLPKKERIVFIETFLNEKKQKDIADEMGMSVKTISRYQTHIIERLKEELRDYLPSLALLSIFISNLER